MKGSFRSFQSLSALVIVLLAGCSEYPCESKNIQVERVFWHEGSRYSFVVKNSDGSMQMQTENSVYGVKIYQDVPVGESMRVELSQCYMYDAKKSYRHYRRADIHLRSIEDLNGADWNHGKHGRGSTTPLK